MPQLSRRQFISGSVASAIYARLAVAKDLIRTNFLQCNEVFVSATNIPDSFNGFRIGVISDIHLGAYLRDEVVDEAVDLINLSKVDCVLLAGDYIWAKETLFTDAIGTFFNPRYTGISYKNLVEQVYFSLSRRLKNLNTKNGVFAVYGNHDRWDGPTECRACMRAAGIFLMSNQSVSITRGADSLTILGVDDYWAGIPQIPTQLAGERANKREFRVLLSHNPDFVADCISKDSFRFDLAVCGHTHGGQIKLPVIGAIYSNIKHHEFREGLVETPLAKVYTTRGIGTVEFPIRIGCPPEVSVLELRKADI